MRFSLEYPSPFDISEITNETKFFLGDRWIDVGNNEVKLHRNGGIAEIVLPDIEEFLIERQYLNDGTMEWLEWGPTVN